MLNWDKITLYKFQQLDAINSRDLSDIDKVLFSACIVFDMTEYELDNEKPEKVLRMTDKLTKIFQAPFAPEPCGRIGKYFINYDISKISFGQYIELSFFLSQKPIQNAHYIMASLSHTWGRRNNAKDHRKKSDYFLKQPISKIMGGLNLTVENFQAFNNEYKKLFGLDKEVTGDVQEEEFNKRYGWIYSASQVAEYERITLDETFLLPIRHAFNDLTYLKAKGKYEAEQLRKTSQPVK